MVAWRHAISLLRFNSISHTFAAFTREISNWTLEEKFHIYARPCIILHLSLLCMRWIIIWNKGYQKLELVWKLKTKFISTTWNDSLLSQTLALNNVASELEDTRCAPYREKGTLQIIHAHWRLCFAIVIAAKVLDAYKVLKTFDIHLCMTRQLLETSSYAEKTKMSNNNFSFSNNVHRFDVKFEALGFFPSFPVESPSELAIERLQVQLLVWSTGIFSEFPRTTSKNRLSTWSNLLCFLYWCNLITLPLVLCLAFQNTAVLLFFCLCVLEYGHYVYIETSLPRARHQKARLVSPTLAPVQPNTTCKVSIYEIWRVEVLGNERASTNE